MGFLKHFEDRGQLNRGVILFTLGQPLCNHCVCLAWDVKGSRKREIICSVISSDQLRFYVSVTGNLSFPAQTVPSWDLTGWK